KLNRIVIRPELRREIAHELKSLLFRRTRKRLGGPVTVLDLVSGVRPAPAQTCRGMTLWLTGLEVTCWGAHSSASPTQCSTAAGDLLGVISPWPGFEKVGAYAPCSLPVLTGHAVG